MTASRPLRLPRQAWPAPFVLPVRRPSPRPPTATRAWVRALDRLPWVYAWAYCLWVASAVGLVIVGECMRDSGAGHGREVLLIVWLFVTGAMSIALSRPISQSRDCLPWIVLVLIEGRGAYMEHAPWLFRLSGSALVGCACGWSIWLGAWNTATQAVGVALGIGVGLAVWVWTWFAFSEMEE